jgi:hypothetical protein
MAIDLRVYSSYPANDTGIFEQLIVAGKIN